MPHAQGSCKKLAMRKGSTRWHIQVVLDIVLGEVEVLKELVLEVKIPLPAGVIGCDVCVVAGLEVVTVGMAV
jgi:hypothetical protein